MAMGSAARACPARARRRVRHARPRRLGAELRSHADPRARAGADAHHAGFVEQHARSTTSNDTADATNPANCTKPTGVQNLTFSKTKYPNMRKHFLRALRKGWPRTLVLNRDGAAERRARLLQGVATKSGYDRD
jgi:hypothetical protein